VVIGIFNFSKKKKKGKKKKFKKKNKNVKLNVLVSTEPSNVVWENMEYSRLNKHLRRSVSYIFTLIFIVIAVSLTGFFIFFIDFFSKVHLNI
jgi:hypothetical protein